MKINITNIFYLTAILFALISCSPLKYVADDEYILSRNIYEYNGKKKSIPSLDKYMLQKPEKRLLKFKENIYAMTNEEPEDNFEKWLHKKNKRERRMNRLFSSKQVKNIKKSYIKFNGIFKNLGTKPLIYQENKTKENIEKLKSYYNSIGYFDAEISVETDTVNHKKRRLNAWYIINTKKPYYINDLKVVIASKVLDSLYRLHQEKSYIKIDDVYNLEVLQEERKRIINLFANNGIYGFNKNLIKYRVKIISSEQEREKVDLTLEIMYPEDKENQTTTDNTIYKIHKMGKTKIYLSQREKIKNMDSIEHKNIMIYRDKGIYIRPNVLTRGIKFMNREIYKNQDRIDTRKFYNNFKVFKYSDIKYEYEQKGNDSVLSPKIYLLTNKRYSLAFNADVSNSLFQDLGIASNMSLVFRNLFKTGEELELQPKVNFGFQKQTNQKLKYIYELGGNINLRYPTILLPFVMNRIIKYTMAPQTQISLGIGFQKNIGLDKQNLKTLISYSWSPNKKTSNIYELINIQYIQNLNTNNVYNIYRSTYDNINNIAGTLIEGIDPEHLDDNNNLTIPTGIDTFIADALSNRIPTLSIKDYTSIFNTVDRVHRIVASNLIVSGSYSYVLNNRNIYKDLNRFYELSFKFESAGNLFAMMDNVVTYEKNQNNQNIIAGIPYSQYLKFDMGYTKYFDLRNDNIFAIRLFGGLAYPYGNSRTIPFVKSYFAGGPSDNRGWLVYSIGAGTNNFPADFNEANLKLAMNMEYRFNLLYSLKGAFFVDMGNIWNTFNTESSEQTKFKGLDSLQDIYISSGFGLRYDLSLLVLRLDLGLKTHNPSLPAPDRWFSQFDYNNSVFNFSINYPF